MVSVALPAAAQNLTFSASVDKTTVQVGEPIQLTMTVRGDLSAIEWPQPAFPAAFVVRGRSQSTNFSLRAGMMQRSTTLVYVLWPQQAGTFQLGPFALRQGKKELQTASIEMIVHPSTSKPQAPPGGERFTL